MALFNRLFLIPSNWLNTLISLGVLFCVSMMVWLLLTVQALSGEIKILSDRYLDNQPWHLAQLQVEVERMRFEVNQLLIDDSEQQQYAASLAIELVWNRTEVLLASDIAQLVESQEGVLKFLDDILEVFTELEDSLYQLSLAQVAYLLEHSDFWSQEYRSDIVTVFGLSHFRYESLSDNAVFTYRKIRSQLMILLAMVLASLVLLSILTIRGRALADKANRASAAKSEFLSSMSHELRTPLNGIIGVVQLMQTDPTLKSEWLDTLSASSEALLAQINDVLDLSRIETGQVLIEKTTFDLRLLLLQVDSVMRPITIQKNIGFTIQLPSDWQDERWVQGDSAKLRQVLLNLVGNAIKFTSVGSVTLDVTQPSPLVYQWAVTDTGIGIPSNRQKKIFEPFSQAKIDTHRQFGGTGLGLAISLKLTDIMGGTLNVKSEEGKGSTFTLRQTLMPAHRPVSAAKPVVRSSQSLGVNPALGTILVVEDNVINQKVIYALLNRLGYSVELADDGESAIEKMQLDTYRCVLMDIQLPGMDGFDCTIKIRQFNQTTPIIALTANSSEDVRRRALAVGMNDFMTKPFRFEHIKNRLDAVLAQSEN